MFEPKSLEANNEVHQLAKAQGVPWAVLIGIHDQINQGNFVYDSGNVPIVYENWNPGEPNGETREDCAILGIDGGKWYDVPCEWHVKLPFVCESGKSTSFFIVIDSGSLGTFIRMHSCSHFFSRFFQRMKSSIIFAVYSGSNIAPN